MKRKNKRYDADFKRKAVELSYERGNVVEISEELGIASQMLYRW